MGIFVVVLTVVVIQGVVVMVLVASVVWSLCSRLLWHGVSLGVQALERHLGLVLAGYVSTYRVVPGEGARAKGTRNPNALVTLTYVGTQVRLVTVQPLAERTLELFSCKIYTKIN